MSTENKPKKKNKRVILKIVMIAFAAILVEGLILTVIGITKVKEAYVESFEEELRATAIQIYDEFEHEYDGDWSLSDDDRLLKGGEDIYEEYLGQLEDLNKQTGVHYTLFYGDTRYVTSLKDENGDYLIGTQCSDVVKATVLEKGEQYLAENIIINGQKYYGYYVPNSSSR